MVSAAWQEVLDWAGKGLGYFEIDLRTMYHVPAPHLYIISCFDAAISEDEDVYRLGSAIAAEEAIWRGTGSYYTRLTKVEIVPVCYWFLDRT